MGNGTSIGQVRGLGSSHHGTRHWLAQRFTAIGNLILALWLLASFILLPAWDFATLRQWLAHPLNAAAMILLIVSAFWHARLGVQVMAEDYVHDAGRKFGVLALLNLVPLAGAVFGMIAVLRIAVGGA